MGAMGKPKKTSGKKAPKDLTVKGVEVKGGLMSAADQVIKTLGEALNTAARKG
jgi:hypothetical protein